jgi:hypothetical protein
LSIYLGRSPPIVILMKQSSISSVSAWEYASITRDRQVTWFDMSFLRTRRCRGYRPLDVGNLVQFKKNLSINWFWYIWNDLSFIFFTYLQASGQDWIIDWIIAWSGVDSDNNIWKGETPSLFRINNGWLGLLTFTSEIHVQYPPV